MKSIRKFSPAPIAAFVLMLALSTLSFAKSKESSFPDIKIGNFGKMDEQFYRGSRPKPADLKKLAALGIKTVIDLTDNSREREQPGNYDQAYVEMKQYDFYTSNGHGKQLDFVRDYWQQFRAKQVNANIVTSGNR